MHSFLKRVLRALTLDAALYEEVEAAFVENLPWETSTDRQIDFKRTYSRKYYDYAVRWIYNEMALHHSSKNEKISLSRKIIYQLKSQASRFFMNLEMKKKPA